MPAADIRFQTAFEYTIGSPEKFGLEGGESNHPSDRGGHTYRGVTQNSWNRYCEKLGIKTKPVTQLTWSELEDFYKDEYWDTCKLDFVEDTFVCMEVFDSAVLHGPQTAVMFLQRAINFLLPTAAPLLKVDGDLGQKTRAALSSLLSLRLRLHLLLCCNAEQYKFLSNLALRDASQRNFTRGWVKRLTLLQGVEQ